MYGVNKCYTYDEADNIQSITTSVNTGSDHTITATTAYDYDLMNRIVRVVGHDGSATLYEYDAVGNRTKVIHEGGLTVTYEYDECYRLVHETVTDTDGSILMYYGYNYGNAGEKTQVIEVVRESAEEETARVIKTEYGYDAPCRYSHCFVNVLPEIRWSALRMDTAELMNWK